jgi:hypothetical protein
MNHMKRERPTEPLRDRMAPGVAKIPVPMTRLTMRKVAVVMPMVRLASRAASRRPECCQHGDVFDV